MLEKLGALSTFTQGFPRVGREVKEMTKELELCNISMVNFGFSTTRFWNTSQITEQKIYKPIMTTDPTARTGMVCFTRQCLTPRDCFLVTSSCKQTVTATCGMTSDHGASKEYKWTQPSIAPLNLN